MSATDTTNPFAEAEVWETSLEQMLPIGPHVVRILEAEGSTVKSSGNPQIDLKFGNEQGTIRGWEAYHSEFLSKVVALYLAAGLERPAPGEFNPEDRCRLTDQKIAQLIGKSVGIVVKDEPDNMNPGKTRRRVAGYVPPSRITGGPDTRGLPDSTTGSSINDADIPF